MNKWKRTIRMLICCGCAAAMELLAETAVMSADFSSESQMAVITAENSGETVKTVETAETAEIAETAETREGAENPKEGEPLRTEESDGGFPDTQGDFTDGGEMTPSAENPEMEVPEAENPEMEVPELEDPGAPEFSEGAPESDIPESSVYDFHFRIEENSCATIVEYTGSEQSVSIPEVVDGYPVTAIGDGAFKEKKLTEAVLPEGIQRIGAEAFAGNQMLEKLNLPVSVTVIGENAFQGCDILVLCCRDGSFGQQYAAEHALSWEEIPLPKKNIETCRISMKEEVVCIGKIVGADIVITDGDTVLKRGKDYKLVYSQNKEPGIAVAMITGKGDYEGTLEKTFRIVPAEPVMKSAVSAGYDSVKISWKAAKGARTYTLFYKGNGINVWKEIAAGVEGTSYTHVSSGDFPMETGKKYRFTVRAEANGQVSTFDSKGKVAAPVLGRVVMKPIQSLAWNKLRISWDAVPGADGYLVHRLVNGSWQRVAKTGNTFYDHTSSTTFPIVIGTSYTYMVRAYAMTDSGVVYGGFNTKGVSGKAAPDQVQLVSAVNGSEYGRITVRWKKAQGATAYVIYRKLAGAPEWERLTAVNGGDTLSWLHVDSDQFPMEPDQTYVYTVQSYSSLGNVYGSYDQKGVSVKMGSSSGITDEQLRKKAREIIASITTPEMTQRQKLVKCWNYARGGAFHIWAFPDKSQKGWKYRCAWDILTTRAGNCYGCANGFAALARELGYTPYVIEIPSVHCFVLIDGGYWDNMGNKMGVPNRPLSYTSSQISKF